MDEKVRKHRKIRVATMGIEAIGLLSTLNGFLTWNTVTLVLGLSMILVGFLGICVLLSSIIDNNIIPQNQ